MNSEEKNNEKDKTSRFAGMSIRTAVICAFAALTLVAVIVTAGVTAYYRTAQPYLAPIYKQAEAYGRQDGETIWNTAWIYYEYFDRDSKDAFMEAHNGSKTDFRRKVKKIVDVKEIGWDEREAYYDSDETYCLKDSLEYYSHRGMLYEDELDAMYSVRVIEEDINSPSNEGLHEIVYTVCKVDGKWIIADQAIMY